MLVEFKVANFLCFREQVTFSMVGSNITENKDNTFIIEGFDNSLLKTAVIYGANASGKSKMLESVRCLRYMIVESFRNKIDESIFDYEQPFLFDIDTRNKPSHFEVSFIIRNQLYTYNIYCTREQVFEETLDKINDNNVDNLFTRKNNVINVNMSFPEGEAAKNQTRDNVLFLSRVADLNGQLSNEIVKFFKNIKFYEHDNSPFNFHGMKLIDTLKDDSKKESLLNAMRDADISIKKLEVIDEMEKQKSSARLLKQNKDGTLVLNDSQLISYHTLYDKNLPTDIMTSIDFFLHESEGTKAFACLFIMLLETLENGTILFVDELDSSLHSLLCEKVVKLVNNPETNPKNAQLIFTTHNTNLLSSKLFRRDQIWFTEKTKNESTDLYSLVEFKLKNKNGEDIGVRKDANYEKNYLAGRYGAIPILSDFSNSTLKGNDDVE